MKTKKAVKTHKKAWLVAGLILAVLFVSAGIYIGISFARAPKPMEVEASFRLYFEKLSASGKIVLLEAREHLLLKETTVGLLFGDSKLGRFLGIRSDATVEASAWADLSFVIDLYAPESWAVRYDPKNGGRLILAAPPLSMLTPAVLTDSIEIRSLEKSIFLNQAKLEASALKGLTTRFVEAASAMLREPEIRSRAYSSLEALVKMFVDNAGLKAESLEISFASPED